MPSDGMVEEYIKTQQGNTLGQSARKWIDNKSYQALTKGNKPKGKQTNTFQNFLYRYGKTSGTLKQMPGVRNLGVVQNFASARNLIYPAARMMGTGKAITKALESGKLSPLTERASRVGVGKLSGLGINALVQPLGLGPLPSRMLRIGIGKGLSSNRRFRNFQNNAVAFVSGKMKINGSAANAHMKKQYNVLQKAQMMLVQTEMNIRAFAPDVASGQFLLGMTDGPAKYQNQIIDFDKMTKKSEFNKLGVKNLAPEDSKFKYEHRDVFGFTKPGQSYLALQNSIIRRDFKPTIGKHVNKGTEAHPDWDKGSFFDAEIQVGGSPDFPWIWAVEFGGSIPYYQRTSHPDKKGFGGQYSGRKEDKYIPKTKYIQPTFFVRRAIEVARKQYKKAYNLSSKVNVGMSNSKKYYNEWLRIAKQRNQKTALKKYKPDYLKNTKTNDFLSERYMLDRESRGHSFLSQMEQRIPGPRIESAHGAFYSKELAAELGLNAIPENMNISMTVPLRKTDNAKVVSQAAKVFIESGGGSLTEGGEKYKKVFNKVGNYLSKQAEYKNAPKRLLNDTERYIKIFNNMNTGEDTARGARRAELLKEVYNLSTKQDGNKLIIKARKRRSDAGSSKKKGKRPYVSFQSIQSRKGQQLAKDMASSFDVDSLFNDALNMDFDF